MPTISTKKYELKYSVEDGVIILDMIEVSREHRGKGIAKKAIKRFLNKFKNRRVELHAYYQEEGGCNERLRAFYEAFGFVEIGGCAECGYEMVKE